MLVELGNSSLVRSGVEDKPKVTSIHIPEFDAEFLEHTDHYRHDIDDIVEPAAFRQHVVDAAFYNNGITNLPGHETLLAVDAAWRVHGRSAPDWVNVTPHPELTPKERAPHLEGYLSRLFEVPNLAEFYKTDDLADAHLRKEASYWTSNGPPGEYRELTLPPLQNTYMIDGRIMNNNNDGGDALQTVMNGTGTAATATTLTTGSTLVTNALAGHRVYVYSTSTGMAWGNVISNTNAASASVITVDQWYSPLTPGGTAATTPTTPWGWVCVDGGMVSTWFAALATGANSPVNTDHTLATNGNVEYVQAGGTLIRKICPTATDVSASARTVTLVPVFSANSTDVPNLPKTFTVIGFFASMVVGFGGAGGPMKFETLLSANAPISALNDQVTVTETISGS